MTRLVEIDLERCIGCGNCAELCPQVFQMDSTGNLALVIRLDLADQEECVARAIEECPVQCMAWTE